MAKKAEQVEALKRAKDGLDVWDDIHRYARAGDDDAIDPDDIERFPWSEMNSSISSRGFAKMSTAPGFIKPTATCVPTNCCGNGISAC